MNEEVVIKLYGNIHLILIELQLVGQQALSCPVLGLGHDMMDIHIDTFAISTIGFPRA